MTTSPYRAALGAAFDDLHPRLQAYFDAIPAGAVGQGRGVFDRVGTPRRWLWPVLAVLGNAHVMFPVWERAVPFTVENRPAAVDGAPAVAAIRTFHLRGRPVAMVDEIRVEDDALVDRLGAPARVEARFSARVRDGGLRLRSNAVWLLVGRARLRIPRFIAPVVVLTERWDTQTERQFVSIAVTAPGIGRIYQYSGRFRYEITGPRDTEQREAEQDYAEQGERSE